MSTNNTRKIGMDRKEQYCSGINQDNLRSEHLQYDTPFQSLENTPLMTSQKYILLYLLFKTYLLRLFLVLLLHHIAQLLL